MKQYATREVWASKLISCLLALVMAAAFVPMVPAGAAVADTTDTVTLSIVNGVGYSGPNALVNKTYEFDEGATVADLFAAAKSAGDISDYAFGADTGYGSWLESVTLTDGTVLQNAADYSTYWSSYKDGAYANGTSSSATDVLTAGSCFQYAWTEAAPKVAPSDWSTASTAASGTSTVLTIVNGVNSYTGANKVVDKAYDLGTTATVADLFAAAKSAGDISDYAFGADFGYGSWLESVTLVDGTVLKNAADYSTYWSSYKDGAYASDLSASASDGVVAGHNFQYAWCESSAKVAPSAAQWATLSAAATASGAKAAGAATPSAPSKDVTANADKNYQTIIKNINNGLSGVGGYGTSGEQQYFEIAAAAYGNSNAISKDTVIAFAQDAYTNASTRLPFAILECTAAGIDATKVTLADGSEIDLVAELAESDDIASSYVTVPAFALLAYASGPYEVSASAKNSARALIDAIVAKQDAQGGWDTSYGVDTTAMVVAALAAYADDEASSQALEKAVAYLKGAAGTDGGYGNANSTAMVIIAMCSVGEDASAAVASLVGEASTTLDSFLYNGKANDLATAQGFLALVAYQGMANTGKPYNVYTQAKAGQAKISDSKSVTNSTGTSSVTASTGDALPVAATCSFVVALVAAGGLAAMRRRDYDKVE